MIDHAECQMLSAIEKVLQFRSSQGTQRAFSEITNDVMFDARCSRLVRHAFPLSAIERQVNVFHEFFYRDVGASADRDSLVYRPHDFGKQFPGFRFGDL
jgi:hypothetical protein